MNDTILFLKIMCGVMLFCAFVLILIVLAGKPDHDFDEVDKGNE